MRCWETLDAFQQWRDTVPVGDTIALVPTMGALHHGHLSLMRLVQQHAQHVVVSLFVNPLQFAPHEDFAAYPRTPEADLALCADIGVAGVFMPSVAEMYPDAFVADCPNAPVDFTKVTRVVPPMSLAGRYEGTTRPDFFAGVATVVAKLLTIVRPTVAVFGEKDAQQLAVVQRLVADLNLPCRIIPHLLVREASGLAASSRNAYFKTSEACAAALWLSQTLIAIQHAWRDHPHRVPFSSREALHRVAHDLAQALPSAIPVQLDYLDVVDTAFVSVFDDPVTATLAWPATHRVIMAAWVDGVRLIDNACLGVPITGNDSSHTI